MDTDTRATVALIISGLSLLVSLVGVFAYLRDRSRVKVRLYYVSRSGQGSGFRVVVTNRGRRQIYLKYVRLILEGGTTIDHQGQFSVLLDETEPREFNFTLGNHGMKELKLTQVRGTEVGDSLGKIHRYPSWSPRSRIRFRRSMQRASSEWPGDWNDYIED